MGSGGASASTGSGTSGTGSVEPSESPDRIGQCQSRQCRRSPPPPRREPDCGATCRIGKSSRTPLQLNPPTPQPAPPGSRPSAARTHKQTGIPDCENQRHLGRRSRGPTPTGRAAMRTHRGVRNRNPGTEPKRRRPQQFAVAAPQPTRGIEGEPKSQTPGPANQSAHWRTAQGRWLKKRYGAP